MRKQRLVFGEAAELYDRARAGHPEPLINDVLGFAGAGLPVGRALEVGAGTGKATVAFADRGLEIVALEPDPAIAAVTVRSAYGTAPRRSSWRLRHQRSVPRSRPDESLAGTAEGPPRPPPDAVQRRLKRIEGQVRGLQRMVDEDRYCINILEQVSAVTWALQSLALELLDDHHCVADGVRAGTDKGAAKLKEASAAIGRLVRS